MRQGLDVPVPTKYSRQTECQSQPITQNGQTGGRACCEQWPDSHDQGSYEEVLGDGLICSGDKVLIRWVFTGNLLDLCGARFVDGYSHDVQTFSQEPVDLIISADVLCYFGAMKDVLQVLTVHPNHQREKTKPNSRQQRHQVDSEHRHRAAQPRR